MSEQTNQSEIKEKFDIEIFNEIPVITTSSPSMCSESDLLPLPVYKYRNKHANNFNSTEIVDEFDTSFINNNNSTSRRVSFLRSPTPNNMNTSGASRGNVRRWSQSLTSAAKTKQQRTINFMPSRLQKLPTALSMDGQLLRIVPGDTEIDDFVQEIEQHDYLMEDSAAGEQLRIATLRSLPQSLSIKRRIKSKVEETVSNKSRRTGTNRWKRARYFVGFCRIKTTIFISNAMRNAELWYDSMKEIEGYFGAGAGAYFSFFRYLFVMNIFLMIPTLMFIVVPQLLHDYFKREDSFYAKILLSSNASNDSIKFIDILTAKGHIERSMLFYGSYTTQKIQLSSYDTYSLPYAYLMTMVCLYATNFIVLSILTAESYRKSFIATSGGEAMQAHKLFCSWDFGISNERAAQMKRNNIYLELKSIIHQLYDIDYQPTIGQKFGGFVISMLVWLFVSGILVSIGYAIIYLDILKRFDESEISTYLPSPSLLQPIIIIVGMISLQTLFEWLGTLEDYKSARSQLHIALIRNYMLELVMITSLVVHWLSSKGKEKCWETAIGQAVYRLLFVDFVFVYCCGSILRLVRYLIYKFLWNDIGLTEFNMARGCLGLTFNQTLLWIGLFFSPPLAAVVIVKMILTFYLKKIVLIRCCKPPSKLWRSAQTFTLFLAMTFVSLTIVIAVLIFVLTQCEVSKECGPFRNHQFMFHVLRGDILKLQENHFVWQFIMLCTRPAAIGGVLLFLCVLVYYLRSKSRARIAMVKLLKDMLYIEAKDKEFLLANITRVTQGNEWLLDDLTKKRNRRNREFDNYAETSFTRFNMDFHQMNNDSGHFSKQNSFGSLNVSIGSSVNGLTMDVENLRKRRRSSSAAE